MFNLGIYCQKFSRVVESIYPPTSQALHLHPQLVFHFSHSDGYSVALICIFLMINEVNPLYVYLFALWISDNIFFSLLGLPFHSLNSVFLWRVVHNLYIVQLTDVFLMFGCFLKILIKKLSSSPELYWFILHTQIYHTSRKISLYFIVVKIHFGSY